MTELSQPSDTASRKDGREYSSPTDAQAAEPLTGSQPTVPDVPPSSSPNRQKYYPGSKPYQPTAGMVERDEQAWRDHEKAVVQGLVARAKLPDLQRCRTDLHGDEWLAARHTVASKLTTGMLAALLGSRGTGKTQLAVWVAQFNAAFHRRTSRYVKTLDLFLAIRATFKHVATTEDDVVRYFTSPDLLIVDELHERGETEWEDKILAHIIDKRYMANRDTILIANQTEAAFQASVGPSVVDRLIETGFVVHCTWGSFRKGI